MRTPWVIIFAGALLLTRFVAVAQPSASHIAQYLSTLQPASLVQPFRPAGAGCSIAEFSGVTWKGGRWKHPIMLCSSKELVFADAVLVRITGSQHPEKYAKEALQAATQSGAHVAVLGAVPNQPLFGGLKEDTLLAHSFEQFRITGDPTWPVLLPMVGSVHAALDILETELRSRHGIQSLRAAISGSSKRGWTTWLSAVADKRVIGIAPAVFDMLNIPEQVSHARKAYGRDSRMIRAYTELGLTDKLTDIRMQRLVEMIDPYSYLKDISIPILILLGTNDPYWVVDSLLMYKEALPAQTLIGMQPNVGHEALGTEIGLSTVAIWFAALAAREPLPTVNFSLSVLPDSVAVSTTGTFTPLDVTVWSADSDDRDFRLSRWSPILHMPTLPLRLSRPRYGMRAVVVEAAIPTKAGKLRVTSPAFTLGPVQHTTPAQNSIEY